MTTCYRKQSLIGRQLKGREEKLTLKNRRKSKSFLTSLYFTWF